MARLSNLQRTKEIEFKWPGSKETLNLVVRPDEFTGRNLEIMQRAIKDSEEDEVGQHKFLCSFLATVLYSWDLEDDYGHSIPVNAEVLFDVVPITLVSALLEAIQGSLKVDPPKPES